MQSLHVLVAISIVLASFSVSFLALWTFARLSDSKRRSARAMVREEAASTVFIFDGQVLVDATDRAHRLLSNRPRLGNDWSRLITQLSRRFPALKEELAGLDEVGQITITSNDPQQPAEVHAEIWEGLTRIEIIETSSKTQTVEIDRFSLTAMEDELEVLRSTVDQAPFLVWKQTQDGTVSWANRFYMELARSIDADTPSHGWPPARIFDPTSLIGPTADGRPRRLALRTAGEERTRWFEAYCTSHGQDVLYFAVEADAVVKAENALRNFVQTLTKTFAHLPIGLAIFDRDRQLALFNPALTDLTTLPADFLSSRPTLYSFLDQLRNKQMMPEPKDYKGWRQQLTALEEAAIDGTYEESWTLPTGQTYRVSGRPHPDGAVAFLFADISAEISLTRRFRSELEQGQSVLDTLDEAIAVFSTNGVLTMSNAAFEKMWQVEPTNTLGEFGILDASRLWQDACKPNPIWGDIRDFVELVGERTDWHANAELKDGTPLLCRISPLAKGATLVAFTVDTSHDHLGQSVPAVSRTA